MQSQELKWKEQIHTIVTTPHAILKSTILIVLWLAIGVALGLYFNFGITVIFIALFLFLLWFFPFWQPAFSLVYFITGNKNVSPRLVRYKISQTYVISLSVRGIFLAYLVYIAINMLMK
jgi:hypothetical protein